MKNIGKQVNNMVKVITYGTFDVFHYGHRRLLERAKALGDYLIVGVTSDDFDKRRGKINNRQSLMERIKGVKDTGLADEIIVEEYEGQKIDDILRFDIDIFTVGSDWEGHFDYLKSYCKVIYLPRTEGISSTKVRTKQRKVKIGIVGNASFRNKFYIETSFVNGVQVVGICDNKIPIEPNLKKLFYTDNYDNLLDKVDAIYIITKPETHYMLIKKALLAGKHVLCESPITINRDECKELFQIADQNNLVLMDSIKTAYSTAYSRLLLLVKSGEIGDVVSVDTTCTSLLNEKNIIELSQLEKWNSICAWGPTAMLPIFQLLGTDYIKKEIFTYFTDKSNNMDAFTKIDFIYSNAVASMKVANGAKSEGEMIISGTKGYILVPAPWWKTDYFEVRYEHPEENKRFFYQLDGEGIRYEVVTFAKAIEMHKNNSYISENVSMSISKLIYDFDQRIDFTEIG